jgi:hypothetical protein
MRYLLRLLVPLVLATFALAGVGATSAVAADTPTVSFVGTYTVHVTIGTAHEKGTLRINADGTAVDTQNGNVAHWKASGTGGRTFTMKYHNAGISETFIGTYTKKGISTKKKPGSYSNNQGDTGTWYGIRTA